uniref:Uncharacterized protein n=1 Tax=Anguilla anguilla TaxID=7936 RepID=A0A0E9PBB6_ANGAN
MVRFNMGEVSVKSLFGARILKRNLGQQT